MSHPGRLAVFRLLVRRAPQGVRPSEIASALGLKPNTLSAYLARLSQAGLLHSRRAGRSLFYSAELERMGALLDYLAGDCCRGRADALPPWLVGFRQGQGRAGTHRQRRPYNVLFVCTGNSARSIFAEAILNKAEPERFTAFSAGTRPYAKPNSQAVALLEEAGYETAGLRSEDLSAFQGADAPEMDFVFTVCDRAANEDRPPLPGRPVFAHWGVADPLRAGGNAAARRRAFAKVYDLLEARVGAFRRLPLEELAAPALQRQLDEIGKAPPEERVNWPRS